MTKNAIEKAKILLYNGIIIKLKGVFLLKKLLSIILSIAIIMSVVGVVSITSSATTIEPNSSLLTDTTDFDEGLSSIELSEKMITGYNIGNSFEAHELRSAYTRPTIANIQEFVRYKETVSNCKRNSWI